MTDELAKGHLDLILLSALADGPAHGYAVIEAIRRKSSGAFDLPEGSVYPALHRLERAGLLRSDWSTSSGRRRRVYSLTRRGRAELNRQRVAWKNFTSTVNAITGAGA